MEAQRLIALSLGKIAMSRQQRGGINLHKNLLVASVLHKARTTYMMENFQTMMAKKTQTEKAVLTIDETPKPVPTVNEQANKVEEMESTPVSDCSRLNKASGASNGDRKVSDNIDKENVQPAVRESNDLKPCVENLGVNSSLNSCPQEIAGSPRGSVVIPLQDKSSAVNGGDYVSKRTSCRCAGKRRRSFVDSESGVLPKKPKMEGDENECEHPQEQLSPGEENMQTEQTQITNLVTIFNTGFSGLYKTEGEVSTDSRSEKTTPGHVNVYVTAERPSGHTFVQCDVPCSTQVKDRDTVTMPTVIALAV